MPLLLMVCRWWVVQGRRLLRDDEDAEEYDLDDAFESDGEGGTTTGYRGVFRLGEQDDAFHDYSGMQLKPDHQNRWAQCGAGKAMWSTPGLAG